MTPLPLTALPRALADEGFEAAKYRRIYNAVIDGAIPATQGANGRWTVRGDDLHKIAAALGLARIPEHSEAA